MTPYEYHNEILGVQAKYLADGRDSDVNSLRIIGERGLRHRIQNGLIRRLRAQGPNTPMLVTWASLPYEWQRTLIEKFGEPQKQIRQTLFEKNYERDSAAFDFYLTHKLADGGTLKDEVIEEYTINASVLNVIGKISNKHKNYVRSLRGTPGALHNPLTGTKTDVWSIVTVEANRFKDQVAHTIPCENSDVLRRKLSAYKKNGYIELVHKNFCNKSALKMSDDMIKLLNNLFATQQNKPTATEVARQYEGFINGYVEVINNSTGEVYDPKEFKQISQGTISAYLSKWTNRSANETLRSGDRQKLMAKYKPFHSLNMPKFSNSLISIDDRQPPFEYAKGKRVWFYNALDVASDTFTCWVYGKSKDGIILDFYRQLIRNYTEWGLNMPAELEAESSLNSSFKDTFLREGAMFQHVRIEANNARGKIIESRNRGLRYDHEKADEGWLARPFALSEPNQIGSAPVPMIPYEDIINRSLKHIEDWNNTEHRTIKGKTRWEVFVENQNPNVKPTNWRAILPYLGYKTETSCNVGMIKLQNKQFVLGENGKIAFSDRLTRLMEEVEGRDLDIYWIDDNEGQILKALVYLRGTDRCICEAVAKPTYNRAKIEQTPEDMEARELMSKYVASIDGYINSHKRAIDKVTIIDNRPLTLNNKFSISGINKPIRERSELVEVLPDLDDEYDLIDTSTTFKRSLKDRF
jgi:hypothetical protein